MGGGASIRRLAEHRSKLRTAIRLRQSAGPGGGGIGEEKGDRLPTAKGYGLWKSNVAPNDEFCADVAWRCQQWRFEQRVDIAAAESLAVAGGPAAVVPHDGAGD